MIPGVAMALEEPAYQVIAQYEGFELRRYAPYIVAEVDVPGDFDAAGNNAFRILAGYIFGDNTAAEKMEMTAPVTSSQSEKGEKMAMTAPVTSTAAGGAGLTTYAFVMERKYTMDSLPKPTDDRVRIREIPARTMAVREYAGRWTQGNYEDNEAKLREALEANGIPAIGKPILARYNSPFSPPFLRRNEVMYEVMNDLNSNAFPNRPRNQQRY